MFDILQRRCYNNGKEIIMTKNYRQAWRDQKGSAIKRGIEWQFESFEQWLDWWGDDIAFRGNGANNLVMARYNDTGPYHPDNVKKITFGDNSRERNARIKPLGTGRKGKPITFQGTTYKDINEATEQTGLSRYKIYRALKKEGI